MIPHDARFYFANLASDVLRCINAAVKGDEGRYIDSFTRARKTLGFLRASRRPEAYEEGLLLMRALTFAREGQSLEVFARQVNKLAEAFAPLRS